MGAKEVYFQGGGEGKVQCKSNDLVINNQLSTPSPYTLSFFTQNELKLNNSSVFVITNTGTTSHMMPSAQCLLVFGLFSCHTSHYPH